jgi:hypothetical protein
VTTAITLQDITIYPVVEQQGPFFDVMEFFPTLTKELPAIPRCSERGTTMTDPRFEDRGRSSSGHYSRWPDPWRPKDDWGPLTAAVLFLIILAGLIFYGIAHL